MTLDEFERILLTCYDESSRTLPSGARFIRHLLGQGPLAYLHTLYAPLSADAASTLEAGLGQQIPESFQAFLSRMNGAVLYDGTVFIYGHNQLSRSLALEDQVAISLVDANEEFATRCEDRWSQGWRRIGSVVGWSSKRSIDISISGICAIMDEDGVYNEYPSLGSLLGTVVRRLETCFTCDGIKDQSYRELEQTLASLIKVS